MNIRYMKHEEILFRLGFYPQDTSSLYIFANNQILHFYMYVYICSGRSQDNWRKSVLFYHVESCSSNFVIRLGTRLLCSVSHLYAFKILEWVTLWTLSIWDMIYYRMKFKGGEWKKKPYKPKPRNQKQKLWTSAVHARWAAELLGYFRLLVARFDISSVPWESNYLKIHSKTKKAVPYLKAHTVGLNYQHDEIDIILITTALKHCSKQRLMLKPLPCQSISINDCIFQGYSSTLGGRAHVFQA